MEETELVGITSELHFLRRRFSMGRGGLGILIQKSDELQDFAAKSLLALYRQVARISQVR